ncbi:MAG TPA: hypothetical protein VM689_17480 [Aliidongia sp.]|nr:hypothetical protein [Aliidongia sp.]
MNRKVIKAGLVAFALSCGLFSAASHAQQFSASVVDLKPDGSKRSMGESGKLYVSDSKIRIDRSEASDTRFVIDTEKATAIVIAPGQRLYMDAKQSSILTELLVPVDPEAPCAKWEAMAKIAGDAGPDGHGEWQCEQAGTEDLNGRSAVKITMTSPRGVHSTGWIDDKLKFLIKMQTADGAVIELRDIAEGPQQANLFDTPAGFHKYDVEQLIARVKQTDAWVEPVK